MRRNSFFLILSVVLVMVTISFRSSFAQNVDLSDMDNAQLMQLLQTIMQQLDSDRPDPTGTPLPTLTPTPTATPVFASDPLADYSDEELMLLLQLITDRLATGEYAAEKTPKPENTEGNFEIYELKKLIIERIPDYMFIQNEPDNKDSDTENKPTPVPGTVCDPQFPNFCFWTLQNGNVVCVCSELG